MTNYTDISAPHEWVSVRVMAELKAEIATLKTELEATDKILEQRNRIFEVIPECKVHGSQCVPHAVDWVLGVIAENAALKAALGKCTERRESEAQ